MNFTSILFCKVIEVAKFNSLAALAGYTFKTSGNSNGGNELTELTIAPSTLTGDKGTNIYVVTFCIIGIKDESFRNLYTLKQMSIEL